MAEGLVKVDPFGSTTVGTVRLPPLISATSAAAPGFVSISISWKSTPARESWAFSRTQKPHQRVVKMVGNPGDVISIATICITGARWLLFRGAAARVYCVRHTETPLKPYPHDDHAETRRPG